MTLRLMLSALVMVSFALGDTLTLRSGKVIEGTFVGGDSRQIRMLVGDRVQSFSVSDVRSLQFGAAGAASEPAPAPAAPASTQQRAGIQIPAGTEIVIRMIDDVDSQVHRVGQTFKASLDEPIIVDGRTLVARHADVLAKLVEEKESGRLTGRAELTLALVSFTIDGKTFDVVTQEVTTASESRTGQTAKVVGGATALGAIVGAIAGGGRGAAIGAASGAGAGTAVQVITKGERVRIPSESRLVFTLQQPVSL